MHNIRVIQPIIRTEQMQDLIEKKEKIAYRLRYASTQGWATELLEKEYNDIKNEMDNLILAKRIIARDNNNNN